jgi:uncharacterized membrane protein (UPF0127 family)
LVSSICSEKISFMKYSMKWLLLVLLFVLAVVLYTVSHYRMSPPASHQATAYLGGREFHLDITDTPLLQAQGLSRRASIPADGGMLFVFDHPDRYTFWMKDMEFPIDIFWVYNGTIVFIKEHAPPPLPGTSDIALERFRPPELADTVIETRANVAADLGISTGQSVRVLLP